MEINVILEKGVKLPTKAHYSDAGFDIYSPEKVTIPPRCNATIDTGVHFQIPDGYVGFIKSKSGLNVKNDLLTEGVIDAGYTGTVKVKIYNNGRSIQTIDEGQKLTQIVFLPIPFVELKEVGEFEDTERGNGGFGSSGKY